MRLLTERSVTIACSANAAYRYVTDLERFGEWFPGVLGIASIDSLERAVVGKQYRESVAVPFGNPRDVTITVKEAIADELFVTEGTFAPLLPRMEVRFVASGPDACTVTWRMLSRNDAWAVRVLLAPLAGREIGKRAARALARLKSRLEGSAGA